MNKRNQLLTFIALLSLPLSQFLITKLQLEEVYIMSYWLGLGLLCGVTLIKSRSIMPKNAILRGTQMFNLVLGGFGLVTSFLIGLPHIL
ncbi:hypothetical protein HBN50_11060 [Halobacteriovorax sp. GB3]|uniref:hypothetical protein n=1 Tax=Halobacteriovorax sp. GB3 TaxID=2719615 RepID=UPI00235F6E1F|nr:hypothetical protein [Halobacteriovorax sp. GB3]MDD0853643.1 hypothetical protein [Halobacteriovorax sp. GB3]